MNPTKVSIVLLNWNGKYWLEKFLPSIITNSVGSKIVVADNGSTDDSIAWLKDNYPAIEIFKLKKNFGYAGGYAIVLKEIKTKYCILMNTDIEPAEGWLEPLLNMMEKDEAIAALQPKILSYQNKEKFDYAGAAGGFIDLLGIPFCRGRILDVLEVDNGQYDDNKEIFWASGACLMVRMNDYHFVGGLDKDYFAHMEEIDLCWRFHRAKKKVMYCGKSIVFHVNGGTLRSGSPKKHYLNFRNSLYTLFKNLPPKKLFVTIFLRLVQDGLAGLKMVLKGDVTMLWLIFKAHISFYLHIPDLLKKRKACKLPYENEQIANLILQENIIWLRYFKKYKTFKEIEKIWRSELRYNV